MPSYVESVDAFNDLKPPPVLNDLQTWQHSQNTTGSYARAQTLAFALGTSTFLASCPAILLCINNPIHTRDILLHPLTISTSTSLLLTSIYALRDDGLTTYLCFTAAYEIAFGLYCYFTRSNHRPPSSPAETIILLQLTSISLTLTGFTLYFILNALYTTSIGFTLGFLYLPYSLLQKTLNQLTPHINFNPIAYIENRFHIEIL